MNYFNSDASYLGTLDDGRYWDSILASIALMNNNCTDLNLEKTFDKLIKDALQPSGGLAYGIDFEYAPDIDDTALFLYSLGLFKENKKYKKEIDLVIQWLLSMQNRDGGWAAFDKDKNPNDSKLFWFLFSLTKIDKSAEIFGFLFNLFFIILCVDISCPDIVGHVFSGLGQFGLRAENNQEIAKAITYLKKT